MNESAYIRLISGEGGGLLGGPLRLGLSGLSVAYRSLIGVRNRYYDTWALPKWLDVPVISVGNLTVGGTGKTPMTILLCRKLLARGLKPAVLSRGYRVSSEGIPDEIRIVARRCPDAVAVANPDRYASGQLAIEAYGAQAAILDDGFQHRRVGRDLDIVLIDATRPFGFRRILPRGLLREPLSSLARSELVIVTRSDQVEPDQLEEIERTVRRLNAEVTILRSVHAPAGWSDLAGENVTPHTGARVGAFAGIARPDAFVRTLESQHISPVGLRVFGDHHDYRRADCDSLVDWVRSGRLDALVTTEKDAVKLNGLDYEWPCPVDVLRIGIALTGDDDRVFDERLDRMLSEHTEDMAQMKAAGATDPIRADAGENGSRRGSGSNPENEMEG